MKAAFSQVQQYLQGRDALRSLCEDFTRQKDVTAGRKALRYLEDLGTTSREDVVAECLQLMAEDDVSYEQDIRDNITACLLRRYSAARAHLANQLQRSAVPTFREFYTRGDGSANGIIAALLDQTAWPSQSSQESCEKDAFLLFVAKLMESGHDDDARAIRGVAGLLTAKAEKLQRLVDEETFDVILASLDNRLPLAVRSQATLATAKYLEVSQEKGQKFLSNFITTKVTTHTNEDLVLAFSAAAAVFPLVPSVASALFLTEGFLPSLIPLLEKKAKSGAVEQAALEMLSSACIDSACREAIARYCSDWLYSIVKNSSEDGPGKAAVILAKIKSAPSATGVDKISTLQASNGDDADIITMLRTLLIEGSDMKQQSSIEGLAYASRQPKVKEKLAKDRKFLDKLLRIPEEDFMKPSSVFGTLTIINNLAEYMPVLSEEQKRLTQLKAYANASQNELEPDPLDDDAHATARCRSLIDAGVVPFLIVVNKSFLTKTLSTPSLGLVCKILLSLSKTSSFRSILAQQGSVPLLLKTYESCQGSSPTDTQSRHFSAQALARILISVDPNLAFKSSGTPPLTSAIRPLLSLLSDNSSISPDGPKDLLPTFEALLALTNLVSGPSLEAAEAVVRSSLSTIDDLLLSNDTLIQRATTELVCNLMTCPAGIASFADESKPAARRMHILLALADSEDLPTRRAAGGALAMVTEFDGALQEILGRVRGVQILLELCRDEDEGCVHRGVVCLRNLVAGDGEIRQKGRASIKAAHGIEILKDVLKKSRNSAVLEVGVDALKGLIE